MSRTAKSVSARLITDPRDASRDKIIPLAKALAMYERGEVWELVNCMASERCFQLTKETNA